MKTIFIGSIILVFLIISTNAQVAIVATGGDLNGQGNLSYSVGQIDQLTINGENYQVGQGIQQSFELSTDVHETVVVLRDLKITPNPTSGEITLQSDHHFSEKNPLRIILSDAAGGLILQRVFREPLITISLSNLPPATYFLSIKEGATAQVISYKIIKI